MKAIAIRLTQLYYRQLINNGGIKVQLQLKSLPDIVLDDSVVVRQVIGRVCGVTNKPTHMLCFASIDHIQKVNPSNEHDDWYTVVLRLTHIVDSI